MKKFLILFISVLFLTVSSGIYGQNPDSPDDVIFVNTGEMNIAPGGTNGVAIYVPFGMQHTGNNAKVKMNGQANVGGNFYQNATTTVFNIDSTTTTSIPHSSGTFRFVKNWAVNRLITSDYIETTYDRGIGYIAFPNVLLATNDTIRLEAKMGMDAKTFKRQTGFTGAMVLNSDLYGNNVYDASLRITGSGGSSGLVDSASVIVERQMSYYRSTAGNEKLFGFATPYMNTQLSGYYAGNWVRRPVANGTTGHTQYVFGNEQDLSGTILPSQYVYNPLEKLVPTQAYLIKPRPVGFTYEDLRNDKNGLLITDGNVTAGAYDQNKFIFNGKVYSLPLYKEQLFAEDYLFQSPSITSTTSTINWLIGNSYTSPIGTQELIDAMAASPLKFSPYIWVYPAGCVTYQSYKITGTENIIVEDLERIPAMSVFMLRILSGTSPGQFNITKGMQRHAKITHSLPIKVKGMNRAPENNSKFKNQVLFRVTPTDNIFNYDLAAIGLRSTASKASDSFDMSKVLNNTDIFQLYSLSSTNTKLSANGVPLNVDYVKLCFKPVSDTAEFQLEAMYAETLTSEGLWIEDLKTNFILDMKEQPVLAFISEPGDMEDRFLVHFIKPINLITGNNVYKTGITAYVLNDELIIKNLNSEDAGSTVNIYDASGRLLTTRVVDSFPAMELPFSHAPGVYLFQLTGNRNENLKVFNR